MMKKIILIAVMLIGMSASVSAYEKTYAIVVGVADYQNFEKGKGDLSYTVNDARMFSEFLMSKQGGSVPAENVILLLDEQATRQNIIDQASTLFDKATKRDRVIFYFSGHGTKGKFMPYDVTNNGRNVLTYGDVKAIFRHAKCDMKLLFADACFSGNMREEIKRNQELRESLQETPDKKKDNNSNMNIVVMMSCKGDETSLELGSIEQGIFTYYLMEGLGGKANSDGNKYLTIQELFYYLYHQVQDKAAEYGRQQTPEIFGKFNLNLIVAEY